MRVYIFVCGLTVLATGAAALSILERPLSIGFIQGALTLGGGILICGLFSIKMRWHGIIGAGVMAMLGAARGMANLPDLAKFAAGDRPRGSAPLLEFGITAISILLLLKVIRVLAMERTRRMLESEEEVHRP
jgi:hypothetical protein